MFNFTVSVTERQTFKRCRRQWDYNSYNRQSLTRLVTKKALSLGTLVHNTLADWLVNPTTDPVEIYMKYAVKERDKIKETYLAQVGAGISDSELEPFMDAAYLGREIISNYRDFWKSPLPEGFTIVAPEQKINVQVASGFVLEGKFDGLIADTRDRIYILEHKTYTNRPNERSLNSNDQFLAYLWLARKLNIGFVAGIAYDGMWKREKPPKNGTLADLFTRINLHRTEAELAEFEDHLFQEIAEMQLVHRLSEQNPSIIYINRRWEGCFDCAYEPLCTAQSNGEDVEYIKNTYYTKREMDEDED